MALPVVSLLSLAAREVLALDLDTRDLPSQLHREMEQYRRMREDTTWTLLSVDFQVERSDKEDMTGEEKQFANQWLKKSAAHDMVRSSRMVMKRTGKFRWTGSRDSGPSIQFEIELKFEDPIATLHQIQGIENRNNLTVYGYGYLENGKLLTEEKVVKFQPNNSMTLMSSNHTILGIDATGCFVRREQTIQNTFRELVCTWTMRATRNKQNK